MALAMAYNARMNVDTKNPLLKSNIAESKLAQKKMETAIDQNVVGGTAQKALNGELNDESKKNDKQKSQFKKKGNSKDDSYKDLPTKTEADSKIERNPLKLLKLF